jgi:hypothetical protein
MTPDAAPSARDHAAACPAHARQYGNSTPRGSSSRLAAVGGGAMVSSPSGAAPQHGHSYGIANVRPDTSTMTPLIGARLSQIAAFGAAHAGAS